MDFTRFLNCIVGALTESENKWKPQKRKFSLDTNSDLWNELKPCDLVFYRLKKNDFIGGVISYITSSPYIHVEFHAFDGYSISAGTVGVTYADTISYSKSGYNLDLYRLNREITREERLIMEAKAAQALLKPYDYIHLFVFPFLSERAAAKKAGNDAYICSELVAWIYKNADIDLIPSKPESAEAPADIAMSDSLDYIGTFDSNGRRVIGNLRNKFWKEEYNNLQKIVGNIMNFFSVKDEYYKGLMLNKRKLKEESNESE
jgi:hypothetical protein